MDGEISPYHKQSGAAELCDYEKLATSEVLAAVNLLTIIVLCQPFVPVIHPVVNAIQVVVIPLVLVVTIAFAVKDSLRPNTRLHSLTALVLSLPVSFIYFVWQAWIEH